MTEKEHRFIGELKKGKTPMEAARRAGYSIHRRGDVDRLMAKPAVRKALNQEQKPPARQRIRQALERIAFGGVEDAVRFMDGEGEELGEELFPVAELKRRQGGYEVKFYDRLRAMELLERLEEGDLAQGDQSLSKILEESARAMRDNEED